MHPYQYVGRQGLNHPRSVRREPLVDPGKFSKPRWSSSLTWKLEATNRTLTLLGVDSTGEGELPPPQKTKCLYSLHQKNWVVAVATQKSVATASKQFEIPRTSISQWKADGYIDDERANGGNRKGQGRRLANDSSIDEELLSWLLESHDLHLPVSKMILKAKAIELIGARCPSFKVEYIVGLISHA